LDPSECDLAEGDAEIRITFVPYGSLFLLGGNALAYTGNYVIGDSAVSWSYGPSTWASVPEKVRRWAGEVRQDLDTPDLWAELRREREFFAGVRYETSRTRDSLQRSGRR
jgi:hypothetical protein